MTEIAGKTRILYCKCKLVLHLGFGNLNLSWMGLRKLGQVLDKELVLYVSVSVELHHGCTHLKYKKITKIIYCVSCAMCW